MADRLLVLSVSEMGSPPGSAFTFHVRLDDTVIASNRSLSVVQSRAVRELSVRYGQLFEKRRRPQLAREALAAIGAQLFEIWLGPSWPALSAKLGRGDTRTLVVASEQAAVLNLPWELLRPGAGMGAGAGEAIGADTSWSVRRVPWTDRLLEAAAGALPAGPLRVLYMVSAPQDQQELDFEREEELLLRAFAQVGRKVVFDSGDLGSFEELRERIDAFRPHIVHLTGHGMAQDATAYFAFEDERGASDRRSAAELGQLFAGSGVQCAFLSACQAGKAPGQAVLDGLAQGLLAQGVPLVIGWAASIQDDVATQVAGSFYNTVSSGQTTVDRALVTARQTARRLCDPRGDPSWSLPVLYAGTAQAGVFDPTRSEPSPRPSLVVDALPSMLTGYTPHFLGRRRELQQLLPGLRAGELQTVVLTGLGGAGKSTLATRLARKLGADGWTLLAVSSSGETPLSAGQLLQACGDAFLAAGQRDVHAMLNDASLPIADRLRQVVTGLNRGRFVLVLDNFESNLDEGTRRILDAELAGFYRHLLGHLVGGSRVIITSRYLPADVTSLPPLVREWQLGEFREAAFLKFLLRDGVVEQRYRQGELPHDLLVRLHRGLGATPRFLGQIRTVLASLPAAELAGELDRIVLPSAAAEEQAPGVLQAARDAYCERIFTERLYGRLPPQEQRMLSQAAVFGLPVPVEGLAAVAGATVVAVREASAQWRSLALVHADASGGRELWSVYGTLRAWLLAPARLSAEERRSAHLAAGDFLSELDRQDREGDLGVSWITCVLEARTQYLVAGALDKARAATARISGAYLRQGLYAELERLHAELLGLEEHADTLGWLGRAHVGRAQNAPARDYYQRVLDLAGEADKSQVGDAWRGLASIDLNEGAYPAAREKFARALGVFRDIGNRVGEASIWHQLALIDVHKGDYPAAREKFERSLAIKEDRASEAASWHGLATIDLNEGAYPAAREKFARSLAVFQDTGNRAGESGAWHQLATIDLQEGDYGEARKKFAQSLAISQDTGNRAGESGAWHQLATTDLQEGDYSGARAKFARSLAIKQGIGDRFGEAATWHQLATIDLREGAYPAARETFARVLAIRQDIGDRAGEAATRHQLASIDLREGAYPAARETFARALAIRQDIGDRAGEAATWFQLASIDLQEDAYSVALEKFARSLTITQDIGDRAGEAANWHQLGWVAAGLGKPAEGLRLIGLCYLLDREIGHGDSESDLNAVEQLAARLDYTQEQLTAELQEATQSYARDRGAELLRQAFAPTIGAPQSFQQNTDTNDRPFVVPANAPAGTSGVERAARPVAPGSTSHDVGITRGQKNAEEDLADAEYPVWYGTNRRPNGAHLNAGFSAERDSVVHQGLCRVFVPKSHKIGSLGSSWWKRLLKMTDDRLRLLSIEEQQQEAFWAGIAAHLRSLSVEDQTAVIFVHGYNVTFEAAALRAAQIGFDLSIKGVMAFFSWPSRGLLEGYPADAATIEASEGQIADFMTDFVLRSGAKSVHVIAHSMGNRGVLRAVNRIAGQAQQRTQVRFGQIILAAADVDADVFRTLSAAYAQVSSRTTLYVSSRDLAVEASRWLHDFPRAGLLPPVLVTDHMDTVSVTNADLTMLGHGYVADARGVLQDIHNLFVHGAPPAKRFGLREARNDRGQPFWLIGS